MNILEKIDEITGRSSELWKHSWVWSNAKDENNNTIYYTEYATHPPQAPHPIRRVTCSIYPVLKSDKIQYYINLGRDSFDIPNENRLKKHEFFSTLKEAMRVAQEELPKLVLN